MGSTADHQHDYEERRVPPAQWEKGPENYPENYPVPCPITEQVVRDLKTRSALGLMKYGQTLARKDLDLRAWLQNAYEEALDMAKYLKRAIAELDAVQESSMFTNHEQAK